MEKIIIEYLSQFDLDVRKSGDARFMDQKCTPDVVCFISDCIINNISDDNEWFTCKDIWESNYFINNTQAIFGKPSPKNKFAASEYDKFIQQPLKLLAYSHVLNIVKKSNKNYFQISNREILDFISQRERNTFNFMFLYLDKVLSDSNIIKFFERYKESCKSDDFSKYSFLDLKEKFTRFIIGNTSINGKVEINRIFPKILNIYAVKNNINGSKRGIMSKYAFTFSELMYNDLNWRDLDKEKSLTRQEAEQRKKEISKDRSSYSTYAIQKAMRLLERIQKESEVHDQWGYGEATQKHHIFPKSQYPSIAHYIENIIKLTATQHFTKAHPKNKTSVISVDYQLTCLLAKADTIEKSFKIFGDKYYRKESFIHVLNVGLANHIKKEFKETLTFEEIKHEFIMLYNNI